MFTLTFLLLTINYTGNYFYKFRILWILLRKLLFHCLPSTVHYHYHYHVDNFDIHKWNLLILKHTLSLTYWMRKSWSKQIVIICNSFLWFQIFCLFKLVHYFSYVISASFFAEALFSFVSLRTAIVPVLSKTLDYNTFVQYCNRSFSTRVYKQLPYFILPYIKPCPWLRSKQKIFASQIFPFYFEN